MEKITFKSLPSYYIKEKSGIKNNTLRKKYLMSLTNDKRLNILQKFNKNIITELEIEIQLAINIDESFVRKVTDVTEYEDFFIITWKHEED